MSWKGKCRPSIRMSMTLYNGKTEAHSQLSSRVQAVESWKSAASSQLSQCMTHSKFYVCVWPTDILQSELHDLAPRLCIPLYVVGRISINNL